MTAAQPPLSLRMAEYAQSLRLADVPSEVAALARLHVADALGVGLGAASVPVHRRMLQGLIAGQPAASGATVLGFSTAVPAATAALFNGMSIHSLEYDDTHMGSIVHGSAVVVAAVLAAAEEAGRDMDEVVRLVVAGWELLVRLGEAAPGDFQRRGFQVTSVGGVVVAALLAALARGASAETAVQAMGIAGSQGGGIFEFLSNGSRVKAMHPGWAAHGGLWAASLAQAGLTGPLTVLEGRHGVFRAYADAPEAGARLAQSLDTLGSRWALAEAAFKFHPCCHYIHPYLECAQQLHAQAQGQEIVAAHCKVAAGAALVIAEPWATKQAPRDSNDAKYSLPYCVALALLGRPVDLAAMTGSGLDADAVALAARIDAEPWRDSGFPQRFAADLSVRLADGRRLQAGVPQVRGSAERPADADQVRAKFMANAAGVLPPDACERAWVLVTEGSASLVELAGCLRAGQLKD
ncbi:MmgE/PrpD family protein [Bordetella genomosp. 13]|uniref:MmgE/PrpD family protein n=1 Tax=Bordetella genomosp. 13 TaxID=463040 RepID=UPI0011AAFE8B|nr:MmgE/PrpD family protein [Bordetella genomosp. 13]